MKKITYAVVLLMFAPMAFAANEKASYKNSAECKAYFLKLKNDEINRLQDKRREMGMGMPMVVYNDKVTRIESRYHAHLKKCKAVAGR